FCQVMLLLGCVYAPVRAREGAGRQRGVHLVLRAAALVFLAVHAKSWPSPLTPGDASRPGNAEAPVAGILGLLASAGGLPHLLLASTGPVLQSRDARTVPGSPYRLFAPSNLASLPRLLAYPLVGEPLFAVPGQARQWAWGFLVFALGASACAWAVGSTAERAAESAAGPPPGVGLVLLWFGLAFVPSLLLLAVTNQL